MTYYLGYTQKDKPNTRGVVLFDIEYYQKQNEKDKNLWYSEIHCCPCVRGIGTFIKDKLNEPGFDYEQFINDAEEIEEIRGLLWERHNNKSRPNKEAYDFHYHQFGKELKEILVTFTEKYGMWIRED